MTIAISTIPVITVKRVQSLLSLLNLDYLQDEERLSIEEICVSLQTFLLARGQVDIYTYKQSIRLRENFSPVYRKQYRIPMTQKQDIGRQI